MISDHLWVYFDFIDLPTYVIINSYTATEEILDECKMEKNSFELGISKDNFKLKYLIIRYIAEYGFNGSAPNGFSRFKFVSIRSE